MGGVDKAQLLRSDGRTFLQHIVSELDGHVASISLLAAAAGYPGAPPGIAILRDEVDGQGPLAGLATALRALMGHVPWHFLVACDLGQFAIDVLHQLAAARQPGVDVIVPQTGERLHATCALYATSLAHTARAALQNRTLSLEGLIRRTTFVPIAIDARLAPALTNFNRPEDLL